MNQKSVLIKFEYSTKSGTVAMIVTDTTRDVTISCFMPTEDAEQLINSFTIAMYEAKKENSKFTQ